jgi:predicted RNase H-like HicB family nuclease
MKYVYPACFYKEDDGRYTVEIPDLNLATYGDDLPDAMRMATDAAAGRMVLLLETGEAFPKANNPSDIMPDDDTGFVSMIYIDLDAYQTDFNSEPCETTLFIPAWMNTAAKQRNIDFSTLFKKALITELAQ